MAAAYLFIFSSFIIGPLTCVGADVWQLNQSYTLNQSNFTAARQNAWQLREYPGSLALLLMTGQTSDISTYLCLVFSPLPSSSTSSSSLHDYSFTLAIYMYYSSLYDRGAIIWTANRDRPLSGNSISLHLRGDGNLVLLGDDPNTTIWSSNTAHKGVTTMELNQNPVSLLLRNASSSIVWQSADYPTDTLTMYQFLLPGKNVTSWASPTDPSSGLYTLVMEPGGLALYYTSLSSAQPYWIWTFYGSNDSFSVKNACKPNTLAAFMDPEGALSLNLGSFPGYSTVDIAAPFCPLLSDYASTPDYLPFLQYGTSQSVSLGNSTILRLGHEGSLLAYALNSVSWSKEFDLFQSDGCLLPSYCGPYGVCTSGSQCTCPANNSLFLPLNTSDSSLGCSLTNGLNCNSSQTQQMLPLSGMDYFSNNYTPPLNMSTEKACVDGCSQNCSCLAAFWHEDIKACHHVDQIGSLRGALNQKAYSAFLKVDVSPQHEEKASNSRVIITASVVSGISALLILVFLLLFFRHKNLSAATDNNDDEEDNFLDAIPGLPSRFSYMDLQMITNNFGRQLGKGGFGAVYAGLLPNSTKVAVKQLESVKQGDKEFRSEVAIMGGIRHNNLLRLLGFCAQKGHRLLVYEYMENGSLDQWLFAEAYKRSQLTWDFRCKIALGTARGLAYLHEDCQEKIIHLDIKPQNILLDESFNAKVADFGLSRLVDRNETHVMTTMRGTPGYLAPDWLKEGVIDEKCDVFSFGMLLMEVISGRKNLDHTVESREQVYFPEWAFWQAQQGDLTMLTDATLETEEDIVQLRRMINTAFLCVLEDPALRPSMAKVVQMLQGHVPVDEIQLSDLHQGLLSVLRSPSSFARARIEEAVQGLLIPISDTAPLLGTSTSHGDMASFCISAR